jgi:hypothetical protein
MDEAINPLKAIEKVDPCAAWLPLVAYFGSIFLVLISNLATGKGIIP